jgi:hypothetical protein
MRVLHVGGAGVDPVELVCVGDGLEFLELKTELPGVRDEVKQIRRTLGGPVINEILGEGQTIKIGWQKMDIWSFLTWKKNL